MRLNSEPKGWESGVVLVAALGVAIAVGAWENRASAPAQGEVERSAFVQSGGVTADVLLSDEDATRARDHAAAPAASGPLARTF
jgi:hypothetical protein